MTWWRIRRWQVRAVQGVDDAGRRVGLAFTEERAWQLAHRRWEADPFLQHHYDCRNLLALGCPIEGEMCEVAGWLQVHRAGDNRTLAEVLMTDDTRKRSKRGW